ncbi:Asp23/Gls24 family envelope stress response protein [Corynebacterium sp. TAE3-ERU16]|uniref:Asp23/Gls24 family envelope stress response protein n=1 Tax=Corynebacterium sp. TAE3-ERU16 TaxID=2849493 RepID=UPI001C43A41D|nr:Asp23/Gls24 family envelope stress response protein [Corynebacterium sp. TAE3-ERU16]MBV7292744.1 Asp23/Gls24 family envelope stress response protein [Corynebacterium sp. TAE3-ERU16]
MTKRSGRSRESERHSSTAPSTPADGRRNGSEETTGSPGARLRAEADRRADQALAEIAREDAKAEEDRRILRENGIAVESFDSDGGDSVNSGPRSEKSAESPDSLSSETSVRPTSVESVSDRGNGAGAADPTPEPTPVPAADGQPDTPPSPDRGATVTESDHEDGTSSESDDTPVEENTDETAGSRTVSAPAVSEAADSDITDGSEPAGDTVPEHLRAPVEPEDHNPSRGRVKISEKTVTKIVRRAAASVPGTTDQAGGLDVLGRNYPRFDVELDSNSDAVAIDAYIAVSWPSPVTRVAETVRTTIFDWVRDMTDIPVVRVNVTVGPIVPGADRVTEAELSAFDTTPTLRPVVVTATNAALDEIICSARNSDLTPVSVRSVSERLRPVAISGPDNAALRGISTGAPGDLRPITVTASGELRDVSVTGDAAALVHSPEVSPEAPLGDITVADPRPLADITVADPLPLAAITVPEPAPLKSIAARELPTVTVSVPEAPSPRSVSTPRPRPLQKVESPEPTRLASVRAPDTHRLAQIHAETIRVSPVKAPRPTRLTPVRQNSSEAPRKPRVDPRRAPKPRNGTGQREITVASRELRPITVKPSTIIPVSVDPANAKAVLRDE